MRHALWLHDKGLSPVRRSTRLHTQAARRKRLEERLRVCTPARHHVRPHISSAEAMSQNPRYAQHKSRDYPGRNRTDPLYREPETLKPADVLREIRAA